MATVMGATCNCLPTEGEQSVIYCYDYQLENGEVSVELLDRGECYGAAQPHYAISIGAVHVCSSLAETGENGLVNGISINFTIPHNHTLLIYLKPVGYTVQGPSNSTLLPLRNLTDPSGRCDFPCVLNDTQYPTNYQGQACFYAVVIDEVIIGNYMVCIPSWPV